MNLALLKHVETNGKPALNLFVNALRQTGQHHLANLLDDTQRIKALSGSGTLHITFLYTSVFNEGLGRSFCYWYTTQVFQNGVFYFQLLFFTAEMGGTHSFDVCNRASGLWSCTSSMEIMILCFKLKKLNFLCKAKNTRHN